MQKNREITRRDFPVNVDAYTQYLWRGSLLPLGGEAVVQSANAP